MTHAHTATFTCCHSPPHLRAIWLTTVCSDPPRLPGYLPSYRVGCPLQITLHAHAPPHARIYTHARIYYARFTTLPSRVAMVHHARAGLRMRLPHWLPVHTAFTGYSRAFGYTHILHRAFPILPATAFTTLPDAPHHRTLLTPRFHTHHATTLPATQPITIPSVQ